MHFLLQRISFTRIQLNPLVKSEPRQLRRKNDTAGGFLSVTNQLSTMENLQNDSQILKIDRLMTDIGALTIRGGGVRKGYNPPNREWVV